MTADSDSAKRQALEATDTFNRRSAAVRHELFQKGGFFDPMDLVQLKYECLRSLDKDGYSIVRAASEFGLSRPTIYQALNQVKAHGLAGLLPEKRGPRGAHKLTAEVLRYLQKEVAVEPPPTASVLSSWVRERFKVSLHPRTIEKALKTPDQKRGRQTRR